MAPQRGSTPARQSPPRGWRRPSGHKVGLAAIPAVAVSVVARAIGAGWLPALGLGLLVAVGLALWIGDDTKSWGNLGEGILVSVVVAVALLAVQRDAEDRIRESDARRNAELGAAELRRQRAAERQAQQLTLALQRDLSEVDFTGRDLRGFALARVKLRGSTLTRAKLDGAILSGADLRGVEALGTSFREAQLNLVDLRKAVLVDPEDPSSGDSASFREVSLENANLSKVSAEHLDFRDATLDFADLSGADFEGANLRGASLVDADLSRANLLEADLRASDLSGAVLCGASLDDADLGDAGYSTGTVWPRGFDPYAHGLTLTEGGEIGGFRPPVGICDPASGELTRLPRRRAP